jgi:outer membrane biosynthesis protein TonB
MRRDERKVVLPFLVTGALVWTALGCGGNPPPPAASAPSAPIAAAPPGSAAPTPAAPVVSANPDLAAIDAARPSFRACYDKARAANPALGRVTVTLSVRVDETGRVTTVNLDYDRRFDDASKGCMRDAAFAIHFPAGNPRRVEQPVVLER